MNKTVKGYLLTILSALMYGFVPAAAKLAYTQGFSSINLTFYRNLFAMLMLGILLKAKGEKLGIASKQDLRKVILLGLLATTVTPLLLFIAYSLIPSSVASTFHFTYPALTILGTALVMHKKVEKSQIFCVLLCTAGIALFVNPGAELNVLGASVALLSGFTFSAYILLLDHFHITSVPPQKVTFYMAATASVVLFFVCVVSGNFVLPRNLAAVGCCVLVAFLSTVGATVLFQKGTYLIGGARSSILSTFEPITSIIVGITIFKDPFSARTIVGSICVVAATFLIALFDLLRIRKEENKNEAVD